MRKKLLALSLLFCSSIAWSVEETDITISGWGGNDVVVVNKLIKEVLAEDLTKEKLNIKYMAVEGDFSQFITNALSSGTAPDIFYFDVLLSNALINSGKVAANNQQLTSVSNSIIPVLNEAFSLKGKQYGIPKDFNTIALQFNKDIFDDAGVAYPTNDDSWDDLRNKLLAIKKTLPNETEGICVMPDYARFAPFALATGWKPLNQNGKTVLDEKFERAFNFYTDLVIKDKVGIMAADLGQSWGGGCFGTEKTAVALEGNWISGYLRDKAPNLAYGSTLLPKDPLSGERGNLLFTVAWGVNAESKNIEAAQRAVELLTSQKAQEWVLTSGLALPSREALGNTDFFTTKTAESELAKNVFDGALNGHVKPYSFGHFGASWATPINEALTSVLLGQLSQKEAIKMAQDKYTALESK
ncbi:extracellular solute-binding protein [Serratia fonticola]|uniref:extracellular solute-binding protein n=1 Tax=Serratia fonticola TaxID=47917 RepID=UPI003BB67AB4